MPQKWVFAKKFGTDRGKFHKGSFGKGSFGKGKGSGSGKKPPVEKLAGNPTLDEFRRFSGPLMSESIAEIADVINGAPGLQEFTCGVPKFAGKSLLDMFGDHRGCIDTAIFFMLQGKASSGQRTLAEAALKVLEAMGHGAASSSSSLPSAVPVHAAVSLNASAAEDLGLKRFPANTRLLYLIMLKGLCVVQAGNDEDLRQPSLRHGPLPQGKSSRRH